MAEDLRPKLTMINRMELDKTPERNRLIKTVK
jgi:hypothetical protein